MIECKPVTITPEMAAQFLARKAPNRKLSMLLIDRYARDMREKRWLPNGESVVISDQGDLLDGQHRLEACLKAHVSFDTVLVTGVEDKAFATMNVGMRRSNADVLSIMGEKSVNVLASVGRMLFNSDRGKDYLGNRGAGETPATAQDVIKALERHPQARQSVGIAEPAKRICPHSFLALVHCLATERGYSIQANAFLEKLAHGEGLNRGNPILVLRNKLLTDKSQRHHELKPRARLAFLIKAFNAYVKNESISHLKWTATEEMPSLVSAKASKAA